MLCMNILKRKKEKKKKEWHFLLDLEEEILSKQLMAVEGRAFLDRLCIILRRRQSLQLPDEIRKVS